MFTKKSVLAIALASVLQACGSGSENNEESSTILPTTSSSQPTVSLPIDDNKTFFGPTDFIRVTSEDSGVDANIDSGDRFGRDHDSIGDVNGDGVSDLIVGARSDDDGAIDAGAVYILFMNANGSVNSSQKISMLHGKFTDTLEASNFFGYGVAGIGDYDGDNIPDVAVSAPASGNPVIYILHLNIDGTVKSMTKNTAVVAQGLSAVGDLNQDGRIDIIAADPNANDGGVIHLLFFDQHSDLVYEDIVTIGENMGGFGNGINIGDSFGGRESALLGDLNNDGSQELAVGAFESDGGLGAIWILSLDNDTHHVVDKFKITPGMAGFNELIPLDVNVNGSIGGHFGHALIGAGDLNGDGVPDLISGANQYNNGVGYILYLNTDKTVKAFTRINENEGGFALQLEQDERFSRSISLVDDHRNDGTITVNMGGGAGGLAGFYALNFNVCNITNQAENTFWEDGITLFTNWDHSTQIVTGALTYEQCIMKAYEFNGHNITAKESDGRCIIKDSNALLSISEEGSQAYIRNCS